MSVENINHFGSFCWVELLAKDIAQASKFYTALLDWKIDSMPLNEDESYFMYKVDDVSIAGGMQINEQMLNDHVPALWYSYVLVQDIQETVKLATTLGAMIIKDVSDVLNIGKMAILIDPTGAVLNLWQATGESEGQRIPANIPGNVAWNELVTPDIEKAGKFYSELFNWTLDTKKMPSGETYTTFMMGEKALGGMLAPCKDDKQGPRWDVYFATADINKSLIKAKELGATPCYEPLTVEGVGTFTMLKDPQNVCFSIIEFVQ